MIQTGKMDAKDDVAQEHFMILVDVDQWVYHYECPILAKQITSQK
jgi:hypothetical protein